METLRFSNGIYPVIPGTVINLGDYGYWKDGGWCHLGNICEIPGMPRTFSIDKTELNQAIEDFRGVEFKTGAGQTVESMPVEAQASLVFKEKGAMYFKGILKTETKFKSPDGEIRPFLDKLKEEGIWEPKYWLAYAIISAEDFISARSNASNVSADVRMDGKMDSVASAAMGFSLIADSAEINIENVRPSAQGVEQFAGARFLSYKHKHLLSKKMTVKFNSSSDGIVWESEDAPL